ncbi:hypothetical protein LTR37_010570 [Vermiconidia calcicola]|uniref:Uncharacterized protein n=1 Tax=Vermiconidia calcicola TaxID=1690605 RepID=A0ACC3N4I1_9PEZI|nr:hypothetical protein LTR37_010570 [Vermiconidia calcicola]
MDGELDGEAAHSPNDITPPSATSRGSVENDERSDPPKKPRRAFLTQNACTRCRQKKSKCDGKRPICGRCGKHGVECLYDVAEEGLTRMQNIQRQLESKTQEHGKLVNLFERLRHSTDNEAANILARLRLGACVDELIVHPGSTHGFAPW